MIRAALLACALALPAAAGLPSAALAQSSDEDGALALTATGEARLEPDMATVSSGVVTQADTAGEALEANAEAMEQVFAALEDAGIAERDVQTSQLSVSPVYSNRPDPRGDGGSDEPRITGYEARNTVTAVVRDLDALGETIDALVEAGANQLQGVEFAHSDPADARDDARREAVAELMRLKDLYADAADIEVGALTSLSESGGRSPQPAAYARMRMESDAATPTARGELSIEVSVTGRWALPG